MNFQLKNIFLLGLLLFFCLRVSAQTGNQTEIKEIYLEITYTYKSNDTIVALLRGTDELGLVPGQLVKAFQSSRTEKPGISIQRDFREVASGMIMMQDSLVFAVVKCYNPKDTLETNDVVSIRIGVPSLPYRSIFSKLAFNNIIFTNANKVPLYNLQSIINMDNRKVEDSVINVILNDLHNTYNLVKDREELPKLLKEKILAGRFKGKIPLEMLRDATIKDVSSFLIYCSDYPIGYMGKNYRASESFAGWITSNSPYSFTEIKNALFPVYKNKVLFNKSLQAYKQDILSEGSSRSIVAEAQKLSDKEKFKEAHELADFSLALVYAVNDAARKPFVHLIKAQIYQDQNKYSVAIAECDKAIRTALSAKENEVEVQAMIKKVYCLYKLSKYNEGVTLLEETKKRLFQYRSGIGEKVFDELLQKIFENKAFAFYNTGDYKLALSTLDTSISINEKINSYDAKIRNAELNKFIGKVNNDKGKPAVALEAFLKAADIYRNNRDISAGAIVGNEIAYSYYLLGEYRKGILIAQANIKPLLESADFDNAGYSHTVAGSCYWELGKYDSAVIENKKSIALRKKGNNLSGQAISWKKIGELYLLSGLKDDALQAFDSAALIFTYLKDNAGLADVYNKKGEVFLNDESYKRATDLFEKAKGVNNKVTVEAFYNLGSAWQEIDTAKARSYFETSRNLSIKSGNTNFQFFSSKSLARNHYRSQNFLAGDRFYDECVSLSQQLNTLEADANCLSLKAYRFYSEPRLDSALFYYQKAFNIFDSVDKNQAIWQLNSLSDVYMSKGEYVKANEVLNKAINLAISTSNNLGLGYTLQVTSFLYGLTAEFEKGINNNDSAIGIFKNSGNVIRLAGTYGSRGSLLGKMGEYRQAVNAYSFADSIYKAELLEENRGTIFNNIGIIYLNQSDYTTALRYFQQSLSKLKKGVYDESYLLVQGNITECLFRLKKVKEAKAILLDILPKARKLNLNRIATGMAIILGNIFADEKNLREAGFYFNYARDFAVASGEKDKMIEALISLGRINSTEGKIDSAENNFRRAAGFVSEYKTGSGWNAYYELGLLFYNQQIFDSAIVYFRQAVELLDKNAENLYGGEEAKKIFNNDPQKADLYNKITFSYYSSGNIKEAWAYANRSNIAGIKELSGTLTAASSDEEKNDALKKLLAMQQSKKALETAMEKQQGTEKRATLAKIEILETDYNNFLQDVVALYPELSTYFSRSNADEFNNYKSKLPKDVAVLLYLLNDKTLMIFSLTNEKLSVDTMTADISQKVVAFIDAIKNTTKKTGTGPLSLRSDPEDEEVNKQVYNFKDISDELYAILFASVSAKVADKRKLCIIPTGIFSNMPFQCLGKKMAGNSFRFLIEDYSIFYTNKMSVFNSNYKDSLVKKDLTSFAAFGVPDATLRFNISEVKEIGKILGTDSTIYTDTRATESMAKNSLLQKKYIHFATHGVLNYSTDFSQSYLKLLPDKDTTGGNNGKLTMREVQKLGITDCEMVILSACQTAISKELVKGWNISPANSFLVSHVKTVVASLWKVADEPTGLLMQYFYENLNSSISKTEALRLAQVRLSNDARYSHPNYWGAFVLYGDWQ